MRIEIIATPKSRNTRLPIAYNHYLQAFIYSLFKTDMPDFHRTGYRYKKRTFKNFTFSRITSRNMTKEENYWNIEDEIRFFISFYKNKAAETAILNLMGVKEFRLGTAEFTIKIIKTIFTDEKDFNQEENCSFNFITLSPIVAHRTEKGILGKKTIYYSPENEQFYQLIIANLKRKAKSVGITSENEIIITPVDVDKARSLAIVKYKDFYIKGHMGIFKFSGMKEYAKLALDAGIGSKNSQGFGMINIIRD